MFFLRQKKNQWKSLKIHQFIVENDILLMKQFFYSQNGNSELCLKIIPKQNLYLCTSVSHHRNDMCHGRSSSISFCKQPLNIHFLALSYFRVFVIVWFYSTEMNFDECHTAVLIFCTMRFTFFTFTFKTIAWNEDKFEDSSLTYVQRQCVNEYKFELFWWRSRHIYIFNTILRLHNFEVKWDSSQCEQKIDLYNFSL